MKNFFEKIGKMLAERRQENASGEGGKPEPLRKHFPGGTEAGFTLIELLACLGIFAVVTGVVLYNYSQFNSNVLITNYAYDVALTIRQAQIYGVAVRERQAGSGLFQSSYGIHMSSAVPNNSFVFYSDILSNNDANYYDNGSGGKLDESLELHSLPGSYSFSQFCAITTTGNRKCHTVGADPAPSQLLTDLDISFKRPEPDAIISTNISQSNRENYKEATICIKSPLGKYREIFIEQTGQISVASGGDATTTAACMP